MVLTRTDRMQQQQWSSGSDGPTRLGFNADADFLEARAAYDDGTTGAVLPVTDVLPGRYFRRSVADGYELHRVQGAAWEWVGGSITPVRQRFRRALGTDIAWSTDVDGAAAAATMTAGGEFGTAGMVRSQAGGSAGADLATDLSAPSTTGRWFVRTRAAGERGVVAAAHDNAAGPLFSAREVGGTYPWTVDSRGRMRAQVSTAFGAAGLTDNVPFVSAASATDLTAADLYGRAAGSKPALRAYGDLADTNPLLSVLADAVNLGRASWAGAVNVTAAAIALAGAVGITGSLAVSDDLAVTDDLTVGDQITAEGGKVSSYDSGSNFGVNTQVVLSGGGTAMRDTRHALTWRKRLLNLNVAVSPSTAIDIYTFTFTPRTTCHPDISLGTHWEVFDPGSAATDSEPNTVLFRLRILANDDTVLFTGDEIYMLTLDAYDPHNYVAKGQISVIDCPPLQLTAGTTYKIQLYGRRDAATSISLVLKHIIGTIREGALIGT